MESQVVELTQEQLDAVLSSISALEAVSRDFQTVVVMIVVVSVFFLAFEFAAFCFWSRVLRE